jgi:triosephosphate isomerase
LAPLKEIPLPVLVVNFKNYRESLADSGLDLARSIQAAAAEARASVAIAPPAPMLFEAVTQCSLPVLSQHVDAVTLENSTGFITVASIKSIGVAGSIVNHSEHRIPFDQIRETVEQLREASLISLVCAADAEEAGRLAHLEPDFIAVEPPELIGSGRAVSKVSPKVVLDSVEAIMAASSRTVPLCGAGIVDGSDVSASLKLGVKGALVSSSIVKNANPYDKAMDLLKALAP